MITDYFIMNMNGAYRLLSTSEMKKSFGMNEQYLESMVTELFPYQYAYKLKHHKCNVKNNFEDCVVCKIFELLAEDARRKLRPNRLSKIGKFTVNSKNQSRYSNRTTEEDARQQEDLKTRPLKTPDHRAMPAAHDTKKLLTRIEKQDSSIQTLQNENKTLHQRLDKYERCLDEVMRKVTDALVAKDSLHDEVTMLQNRVRDLEAQNAALLVSSTKERDERYCTSNRLPTQEPYYEEDWSMSQREIESVFEEDSEEFDHFITPTWNGESEEVTSLLQKQIDYSDDEDLEYCKVFTRDFYRLFEIPKSSETNLQSSPESQFDSLCLDSPISRDVGQVQVQSYTSSEPIKFMGNTDYDCGSSYADRNIQFDRLTEQFRFRDAKMLSLSSTVQTTTNKQTVNVR